ncbi:MAG: efflux RND transporter periplasmic adaptor subunit [Deltaproteobacteria bacterium]|jgi:RND family efflux transporter MFP subunit
MSPPTNLFVLRGHARSAARLARTAWAVASLCACTLPFALLHGCERAPAAAQTAVETPAIRVALEPIDRTPTRAALLLPGLVFPRETHELGFPMGGVVADVLVEEGAHVRRGEILARLDGSAARATRDQAQAGLTRAERELARARALEETGSLPTATFEDAATGADVARAGVVAASYAVGHSVLRAPADGFVELRFVDRGEVVAPGAPVVRVVDAERGWALRVAVPDRFVTGLRVGDPAVLRLDATGAREHAAHIADIARVPTPGMGTFDVELTLDGPPGVELRTGLVGRAALESGESFPASIPSAALVEGRGRRALVFVVSDGRAETREVQVAFVRADRVVLASDLEGVDHVVTRGADRLRAGTPVSVEP